MRALTAAALLFFALGCAGHSSTALSEAGGAAPMSCSEPLSFADATVEEAVRKALACPTGPLGRSQVAGLNSLSVTGASSLSGIECLVGLKTLAVTQGEVVDLTPLVPLTDLANVVLIGNRIADLTPLKPTSAGRSQDSAWAATAALHGAAPSTFGGSALGDRTLTSTLS